MDKRNRERQARKTFVMLGNVCPEMYGYLKEHEAEILAYLETHYQDWDNPEQEATQRRC